MSVQVLVIAKAPIPGRVKTRLCPPCTPEQAAAIAAAALADTLAAAAAFPAVRHTLVLDPGPPGASTFRAPAGWRVVLQHGSGLGERLANAFADTAMVGVPTLLIGMDTPQVTVSLLAEVAAAAETSDAVLGPALDGGWWALALQEPAHARMLVNVAMSTASTCADTLMALSRLGLAVAIGPILSDVDTADDAIDVATACPDGAFAAAAGAYIGVRA